jgi:hypothetical protein
MGEVERKECSCTCVGVEQNLHMQHLVSGPTTVAAASRTKRAYIAT